ncbi:MAG: OmpH family outer membrane protein [Planctomycetaceae bacterium]|nr:OmpH family outer membrane protein [Planctomycetaceae bacterium]
MQESITVKQTILIPLFAAGLAFGFLLNQASAQQAAPAGPPSFFAVVDVAQLIKTHPDFIQKQEALKQKMVNEEAKFKARQEAIVNKEKAVQQMQLRAGTAEHQNAVDEIAGLYADFEKDARAMQRRFALENSQIMFDTFQDIKKTLGAFAKTRRIGQITDYRFFDPNPLDPQSVAEDMDQKLVWFDESLDITTFIIYQMYDDRKLQRPNAEELVKMIGGKMPGIQGKNSTATAPNQTPVR